MSDFDPFSYKEHSLEEYKKQLAEAQADAVAQSTINDQLSTSLELTERENEIVVHWVNKHGLPMDIITRKGGLIHALWLAEHERRNRPKLPEPTGDTVKMYRPNQPAIIDIETTICPTEQKQLPDADQQP